MCKCECPAVRIGDNGRVFCASCRRYLDRYQTTPEALRDPGDEKTGIAQPDTEGSLSTDLTSGVDNTDPHAR